MRNRHYVRGHGFEYIRKTALYKRPGLRIHVRNDRPKEPFFCVSSGSDARNDTARVRGKALGAPRRRGGPLWGENMKKRIYAY